jgi:hypothetical protein
MTEVATHNCVVLAYPSVKVRNQPNTNNTSYETMPKDTSFQISGFYPDSLDPNNLLKKWGKIFGGQYHGKYTAFEYPNNPSPISSSSPITTTPPVEPPTVVFPESFILTEPNGTQAEYVFVRIVTE